LPPLTSTLWPIREGPHAGQTIITFDTAIGLSRSAIPPLTCLCGFGRVCRFTICTPSTSTRADFGSTSSTRPSLPLSFPAITFTVSFFFRSIRTRPRAPAECFGAVFP
jgi:hypothetical protein